MVYMILWSIIYDCLQIRRNLSAIVLTAWKQTIQLNFSIRQCDEFDKVNSIFYNAFYELFDEGKYVDSNYEVDLKNAIFFCTCNFLNEDEIKHSLGPAMHSRIGCCIEYADLSYEQKCIIIENWYKEILDKIEEDEKAEIEQTDILSWFKENANRYNNIRILKTKLENAIFDELTEIFITLTR